MLSGVGKQGGTTEAKPFVLVRGRKVFCFLGTEEIKDGQSNAQKL